MYLLEHARHELRIWAYWASSKVVALAYLHSEAGEWREDQDETE